MSVSPYHCVLSDRDISEQSSESVIRMRSVELYPLSPRSKLLNSLPPQRARTTFSAPAKGTIGKSTLCYP